MVTNGGGAHAGVDADEEDAEVRPDAVAETQRPPGLTSRPWI